jgi:formylglycine-generating enzyme required for sulfatase activity
LATYWIDKYLATNAQYKTYVDQAGHAAPPGWTGKNYPAGAAKQPVQGLTWNDASAYCAWLGKRLPGEAEWEAAGRGPGANPPLYPWGQDPTAGGQSYQLPETSTYEVGSLAWNRSAVGVYDLLDDVWQWVDRPYAPVPPNLRLVRGGRFGLPWDLAHRETARPDDTNFASTAGVRCAASHVAGE